MNKVVIYPIYLYFCLLKVVYKVCHLRIYQGLM